MNVPSLSKNASTVLTTANSPAPFNDLGNTWSMLGELSKARQLFERALAIQEREDGPDHRELAGTLTTSAHLG